MTNTPATKIALLEQAMNNVSDDIKVLGQKVDELIIKVDSNFVSKQDHDKELVLLHAKIDKLEQRRWVRDVLAPFFVSLVSIVLTALVLYYLSGIGLV